MVKQFFGTDSASKSDRPTFRPTLETLESREAPASLQAQVSAAFHELPMAVANLQQNIQAGNTANGMANFKVNSYADVLDPSLKGKTIASDITKSTTYTNTVIGLSEQLPLLAAGVLFGPSFALLGSVYAVVGPSFALLGPVYAVVVPAALLLGALPVVRWLPATGARLARDRPGRVNAAGAALWGVRMLPLLVVDSPAVAAGLFLVSGAT